MWRGGEGEGKERGEGESVALQPSHLKTQKLSTYASSQDILTSSALFQDFWEPPVPPHTVGPLVWILVRAGEGGWRGMEGEGGRGKREGKEKKAGKGDRVFK